MDEKISFEGTVIAIKYRSSENWCVFTVRRERELASMKTVTGVAPESMDVGTDVLVEGVEEHGQYGPQIKATKIIPAPPDVSTHEGLKRVFQKIPGIGPVKADKFVSSHDDIDDLYEKVMDDPSIIGVRGEDKIEEAKRILNSLLHDSKAFIFLSGIGLTNNKAEKIISAYGPEKAIEVVSKNPYSLITDIDGFGFLTVDMIALKSGIKPENKSRLNACIIYCLTESSINGGNTYIRGWELCSLVKSTLVESARKNMVIVEKIPTDEEVKSAIYSLQDEGLVIIKKGKVYEKETYMAEGNILSMITGVNEHNEVVL